jgi:hypothetical protein
MQKWFLSFVVLPQSDFYHWCCCQRVISLINVVAKVWFRRFVLLDHATLHSMNDTISVCSFSEGRYSGFLHECQRCSQQSKSVFHVLWMSIETSLIRDALQITDAHGDAAFGKALKFSFLWDWWWPAVKRAQDIREEQLIICVFPATDTRWTMSYLHREGNHDWCSYRNRFWIICCTLYPP